MRCLPVRHPVGVLVSSSVGVARRSKLVYVRRPGGGTRTRSGFKAGQGVRDASQPQVGYRQRPGASRKRGPCKCVDATDIIDELRESLRPPRDFLTELPPLAPKSSSQVFEIGWGHTPTCTRPRTQLYSTLLLLRGVPSRDRREDAATTRSERTSPAHLTYARRRPRIGSWTVTGFLPTPPRPGLCRRNTFGRAGHRPAVHSGSGIRAARSIPLR